MSKFRCECDTVLRFGTIPNSDEYLLISDVHYDGFSGLVDAEELYMQMKSMLKCPTCGRLWIYWDGFNMAPTCYNLEE
ncbi:MAG: hypothetical protein EOO39_05570 [Cytophagaceae bacterium]|nr:MAG: hypothetical protein EOO39_05570 [Cytophagaceae bacterium]